MGKYIDKLLIIIALLGAIASIITSHQLLIYTFLIIIACGIIFISVRYLKGKTKAIILLFSSHPGLFSGQDLIRREENNGILVSKLIKNVKYSDNNRTSNITYIINGEIVGPFCMGLFLTISAASLTANIKKLGYSVILDAGKMITRDDFHFVENSNIDEILPFAASYKEVEATPFAKKLYLSFPTSLEKGDEFQVVLYYTWENSIIDLTDSTSYHTTTLFPGGIKKLITNLVFTSKPFQVAVYKAHRTKKKIVSKVKNVRQINNLFVIRWEIDNPQGTYILQRTLEKWS